MKCTSGVSNGFSLQHGKQKTAKDLVITKRKHNLDFSSLQVSLSVIKYKICNIEYM